MSYGDHGRPVFSSDPFGTVPPGGGFFTPGPPPGYPPQPPPQSGSVNLFATLSVIFAFICAPAGAVLGHLALSRIKRTGERGRTRALVGITVSYLIIVLAVVALLVWLLRPTHTSASVGSSGRSPTSSSTPVDAALLDGTELTRVLNQPFETKAGSSQRGGVYGLREFGTSDERTEKCVGVLHPAASVTYRDSSMRTFAYQQWSRPTGDYAGAVISVDEAVVAFANPEDAQKLLARATEEWKQCNSQRVLASWGTDGKFDSWTIRDVDTTDSIVTATVGYTDAGSGTIRMPTSRALALKGNNVVDVGVVMFRDPTKSADPETSGIDVARAILDKIA